MLRPITTSSASAGAAPTAVQGGGAATLSPRQARAAAVGTVESAQSQASAGNAEQMFRYNSFQFIYRQDVGRIVLVGQSPETGERVIQVPSEQALRAYERTVRVERQARIQVSQQQSTSAPPQPQLTRALVAAVSGDNHASAVVSVSA
jgi:hypothetical protein